MRRKIVLVDRNNKVIEGDWYKVDENSKLQYPDYSDNTQQDFEESRRLLKKLNMTLSDCERWYTKQ